MIEGIDTAVTSTTIRLGTFLPLSGPMALRGQSALGGLRACLERINAQGGVHGRRLELLVQDDEFDPAHTMVVTQHLVEEAAVFALVAPLGTPTNTAVLDYLEQSGIPVVAPLSGSSLLATPPKRNYFAFQVNYVVEGTLLARYAVETLRAKRIAIFYSNDDFGQEGVRAFLAELAGHNLHPVRIEQGWREEALAAGVIIERLQAAEPDTVLIYTYLDQAAALLQEAERQKFHPRWLGSYVLWDPALFDLAGQQAVEGMIVGQPYLDPSGANPASVAYRRDLASYSPDVWPGGYSAGGYTAGCLLVEGLQRAGSELTRESFISALERLKNWSGGLVSSISYSPYDRRGAKFLRLARAKQGRWITEQESLALRDRLLNLAAPLALQVNILSRKAMEELGKALIRQKAIDVARQCAIFIQHHPEASLQELQANPVFQRIAVQPLGQTGYTAVYGPAPFPTMRFHPNPELIDVDLRTTDRPTRFPDWWRMYQYGLANGGQKGGGFYHWADADGIVRQKYQHFLPIEGTSYILAATTYLEEFFQPFEEAEQAIRRTVNDLTTEIARQILAPIQRIMAGVERVSQGDLNFEVEAGPAEEAQELVQAFNQMTYNLRVLNERWAELNRELEARVAERTQELAETNRQLQLSNRSLQEINRQLSEAKATAERARLEAEEANRLKSRFLSNISHELRAPLNAIINFSKLLLVGSEGPLTEEQSDFLGRMRDAGEHLLGLLNDMLDLSRIEAGVVEIYREETDLADIIHGVMSTAVGLTRDKPIQLSQELEEALPSVWVDRTRIRQVLLNLLANAAKFTERGRITVAARRQGQQVLVSVADTGPGIPPTERNRIFEPYVKGLPGQPPGAGLGLAISRQWVDMHGGSIWVESEPGHGSIFYFTLPAVRQAEPGQPTPAALTDLLPSTVTALVLIVDHDRATYRCLAQPAAASGFRVAGLTDPGLILSKVNYLHPAAVVFDTWQVPGAERLTQQLRETWPTLPLLPAAYLPAEEQGLLGPDTSGSGGAGMLLDRADFVERVTGWLHSQLKRYSGELHSDQRRSDET
ncbi:MAG: ABC transporter substrate-binding protein [Chloroflexi bacterium]|nr:ABC transporter substrate-binding protein [Chloroflexota bacterium]